MNDLTQGQTHDAVAILFFTLLAGLGIGLLARWLTERRGPFNRKNRKP